MLSMNNSNILQISLVTIAKIAFAYFFFLSNSVLAADFICSTGNSTFTPASGDRVIATDSCQSVTINCSNNNQCETISVFAAAQEVEINCTGFESCKGSEFNIGLGTDSLV